MNFGQALEALKAGKRAARAGWNGKGMWLALTPASSVKAWETTEVGAQVASSRLRGAAAALARAEEPDVIDIGAHIDMRAADGSLVIGWLASQTDMLADDWGVVE